VLENDAQLMHVKVASGPASLIERALRMRADVLIATEDLIVKAADVMSCDVITVAPGESVARAAQLMTENDVSALPVVQANGQLVGILSEADLLQGDKTFTAAGRPWWTEAMPPASTRTIGLSEARGKRVDGLMSKNVISVGPDASLSEIAAILEHNRIKRV